MDTSLFCALGGNISSASGETPETLTKALNALEKLGFSLRATSRFWRSPAFPEGAGPDFVNACCELQTTLDQNATLAAFHQVEAQFGRERRLRWGARSLDLDLIAYGDRVSPDVEVFTHWRDLPLSVQKTTAPRELILPHPRLQDRAFVLIPLAEIAPLWRHPVSGRTVREMLDALPEAQKAAIRPV